MTRPFRIEVSDLARSQINGGHLERDRDRLPRGRRDRPIKFQRDRQVADQLFWYRQSPLPYPRPWFVGAWIWVLAR